MTPPTAARLFGAAALVGGVPGLALLALLLTSRLAPGPGLLALLATAGGALALAWLWLRDLARLEAAVRDAGRGSPPGAPGPALPLAGRVAGDLARLGRDVAAREALVEQLRRADAAILEALPDPLLVLSAAQAPLRANAAARAMLGAGGDVAALLRHPALASAADRALAERRTTVADLALPVPVPREIAAQLIPMEPPLGDGGRLVVVLADRTRERAVERMRADFVANASHELRTPLASLTGFIETLRGPAEDDPPARRRFLGIMAEQAERMRRLVDDLLGLARIELLEHQPPTGTADLGAVVRAEAEALAPVLRTHRARLSLHLAEGAVAAPADAEQLAQVVRNLLENAARYGREGGTVRITVAHADAGAGVVLEVRDDGPGIAREHIPRLTERFYRVDKGRSRATGGTGLGLAIVKHITNRHRGRLTIESTPGAGATFRVWLPAPPGH